MQKNQQQLNYLQKNTVCLEQQIENLTRNFDKSAGWFDCGI